MLPDFFKEWDFQNPDKTEQTFRTLLPGAIATGDAEYYGLLLTQLARTLGLQQKFDESHQVLDLAEEQMEAGGILVQIYYCLERGRALRSDNRKDESLPLFKRAVQLSKENDKDALAIDAIHMVAAVSEPSMKLSFEEEALSIAEHSTEDKAKKWLGSLYNNMGWSYMELKDFDNAEKVFRKGLEWQLDHGSENSTNIAYWTIGRVNRAKGNFNLALEQQQSLLGRKDGIDESGYTYEEIGENLLALEQKTDAAPYFAKAYDILSKDGWLVKNESERLDRIKQLSTQQ